MGKFIGPDSPVLRAVGIVGDLVLLNLLFLICCVPIITIGASASALYTAVMKILRKEGGFSGREFFLAFKRNFRQTVPMTLILIVAAALLFFTWQGLTSGADRFGFLSWFAWGIAAIAFLLEISYVFAVQARFQNTIGGTMKNALLLAVAHPPYSVCIAACTTAPLALLLFATYYFLLTSMVWCLFGCAGLAMLNSLCFQKMFEPFVSEQTDEERR